MFEKLVPGQEIKTTVVAVNGDTIFVDLSAKSEGVVDAAEFTDENGVCSVKAGDTLKLFFMGEVRGELQFTSKIKGENAGTEMLEKAFASHIPVEGLVEKEIKGGYEIKIGGNRAFCPFSQMGGRRKDDNQVIVGKNLPFIITEYKEGGKNILVSNRAVLEEQRAEHIVTLSKKITDGAIVEGTVKSLQTFGAFVDVDGFQTLLPISEISFERVSNPGEILSVGQKITAKVLKADWAHERVSISMKALAENPWDSITKKCKPGDKFNGTISRITDFGLFITIDKGIDGLVHVSALKDVDKNTNLKKKFNAGDTFSVVVKEIDAENKRISLIPATSVEQDNSAASYMSSQDTSETYNPFAALLKK